MMSSSTTIITKAQNQVVAALAIFEVCGNLFEMHAVVKSHVDMDRQGNAGTM